MVWTLRMRLLLMAAGKFGLLSTTGPLGCWLLGSVLWIFVEGTFGSRPGMTSKGPRWWWNSKGLGSLDVLIKLLQNSIVVVLQCFLPSKGGSSVYALVSGCKATEHGQAHLRGAITDYCDSKVIKVSICMTTNMALVTTGFGWTMANFKVWAMLFIRFP